MIRLSGLAAVGILVGGLASSAQAADLPVKAPRLMPPVTYNWSGFYAGVNLGGGWANGSSDITQGGVTRNVSMNSSGVLGGVQAGYNLQSGALVYGVETDFQLTSLKSSTNGTLFGTNYAATAKLPYFATFRGRLGVAMDGWMPYVTAGGVYGYFRGDGTVPTGSFGSTAWGAWTVGAGIEVPWMNRWTWKAEYLYIKTPTNTSSFNGGVTTSSSKVSLNVVRVGLNYHF